MTVKVYNLKEEEPCLKCKEILNAVTGVERLVDGDTGKEELSFFTNGSKHFFSMDGFAFVFFEGDKEDIGSWQFTQI
jgi:hypothetical protein